MDYVNYGSRLTRDKTMGFAVDNLIKYLFFRYLRFDYRFRFVFGFEVMT